MTMYYDVSYEPEIGDIRAHRTNGGTYECVCKKISMAEGVYKQRYWWVLVTCPNKFDKWYWNHFPNWVWIQPEPETIGDIET